MLNAENFISLKKFQDVNSGKNLNTQDYIHANFTLSKLPIDLAFCLIKLVSPDFKIVDGLIFLDELFTHEKYVHYLSLCKESSEVQLWLNLVEITGIFEEIDTDQAIHLSNLIVTVWNLKIISECQNGEGKARVIHDKETNEVFIVVDQFIA